MESGIRNFRLKAALAKKSISQVQAAHDLGLNRTFLNLIVNGWENPKGEIKDRICEYLGLQKGDLWGQAMEKSDS
jgi:DNA-binding XRE family transcriptional regulator